MSFRDRLALFLVTMLVVVQALTAAFTYSTIRSSLVERGKNQLATATTVLMKQLDVLGQRVGDDVEVLSLDYALRKAVAEHDPATALSALRNHGNRVGAARMMLVELDGKVSADTGDRYSPGTAFPFPGLIRAAGSDDQATALAVLDGRLYWIVAVPVRAPVMVMPIYGWSCRRTRSRGRMAAWENYASALKTELQISPLRKRRPNYPL